MTRRPRIGIHCPGVGRGGPWRYVHSLLRSIDLQKFDVCVICDIKGTYQPRPEIRVVPINPSNHTPNHTPSHTPAPTQGSFEIPSRHETSLPPRGQPLRILLGFLRTAQRLARVLEPLRLDLFHTQNTGCEEAPVAAWLARIPRRVGTFHTDHTYDLHAERSGLHYQMLERLSNRCLHRAIAVSHATGRNWRRRTYIPRQRVVTIHNGIQPQAFRRRQSREAARLALNLPTEAFIVLGLGRLEEAKGFAHLIDALAMLRPRYPQLLAVIAGEGPLEEALRRLAAHRQANVRLLGFQTNVQPLLDAADLFALPSLCEACPYAVLEAMAAGLPIVASDVGGVRELLGQTGVVLPPRDAPQLAHAIQLLMEQDDLRARLSHAASDRVAQHFDETVMVRRTFAIYDNLLQPRRR